MTHLQSSICSPKIKVQSLQSRACGAQNAKPGAPQHAEIHDSGCWNVRVCAFRNQLAGVFQKCVMHHHFVSTCSKWRKRARSTSCKLTDTVFSLYGRRRAFEAAQQQIRLHNTSGVGPHGARVSRQVHFGRRSMQIVQ